MVATITNPLTGEVITEAERARAAIGLACFYAAGAVERAEAVTPRAHAPLAKAREYLDRARRHYLRARHFGAPADALASAAEAGKEAAAAVAAAEDLVKQATAEAALKRLKVARALRLKGLNTVEAVRLVAGELVAGGYAPDHASAVALIAAEVHPPTATPDLILGAWMRLDAGAY